MHRPRYIQDALYIGRSSGASSTPPDRGTSPWAEGKEFSPCSVGDGGTPPPAAKRQAVASPRDTVGRGLGDGERSGVKPARSSGMADMLAWAEVVEHSAAGQAGVHRIWPGARWSRPPARCCCVRPPWGQLVVGRRLGAARRAAAVAARWRPRALGARRAPGSGRSAVRRAASAAEDSDAAARSAVVAASRLHRSVYAAAHLRIPICVVGRLEPSG